MTLTELANLKRPNGARFMYEPMCTPALFSTTSAADVELALLLQMFDVELQINGDSVLFFMGTRPPVKIDVSLINNYEGLINYLQVLCRITYGTPTNPS